MLSTTLYKFALVAFAAAPSALAHGRAGGEYVEARDLSDGYLSTRDEFADNYLASRAFGEVDAAGVALGKRRLPRENAGQLERRDPIAFLKSVAKLAGSGANGNSYQQGSGAAPYDPVGYQHPNRQNSAHHYRPGGRYPYRTDSQSSHHPGDRHHYRPGDQHYDQHDQHYDQHDQHYDHHDQPLTGPPHGEHGWRL